MQELIELRMMLSASDSMPGHVIYIIKLVVNVRTDKDLGLLLFSCAS